MPSSCMQQAKITKLLYLKYFVTLCTLTAQYCSKIPLFILLISHNSSTENWACLKSLGKKSDFWAKLFLRVYNSLVTMSNHSKDTYGHWKEDLQVYFYPSTGKIVTLQILSSKLDKRNSDNLHKNCFQHARLYDIIRFFWFYWSNILMTAKRMLGLFIRNLIQSHTCRAGKPKWIGSIAYKRNLNCKKHVFISG